MGQRQRHDAFVEVDAWAGVLVIGNALAVFSGPSASASRHRHDVVQILACADHPVAVRFDDGEVRSHVVVVPSRTPHHVVRTDGRVLVVLVEPSAFQSNPTLLADGGGLGQDLVRLAELTGSGSRNVDAETILRRGTSLVEAAGGTPAPTSHDGFRPEVRRAIEVIETNTGAVTRLDDVAAMVALSPSRLSRVFAAEVGIPFRRYVLWSRLRHAAVAVRQGADMTTAAAAAGFSDSAHFSRVFRSTFGLTPSEVLPILHIADLSA